MGNVDVQVRTAEILTRLTVAGERLGVDLHQLHPRLAELGTAPGQHARVSVDAAGERLAIRCRQEDGARPVPPLVRPGTSWYELETAGPAAVLVESVQIVGSRPLAEDLALLVAQGVLPAVAEELGARLGGLGHEHCDLVARRTEAGLTRWHLGLAIGGTVPEVMQVAGPILALATTLGVQPLQRRLLEQSLLALAAPGGFTLAVGCDAARPLPELTVEYRGVPWRQVVGLTDALRPGAPVGPRLGIFAGAFDAEQASALEITFRGGTVAHVRIALDLAPRG